METLGFACLAIGGIGIVVYILYKSLATEDLN